MRRRTPGRVRFWSPRENGRRQLRRIFREGLSGTCGKVLSERWRLSSKLLSGKTGWHKWRFVADCPFAARQHPRPLKQRFSEHQADKQDKSPGDSGIKAIVEDELRNLMQSLGWDGLRRK